MKRKRHEAKISVTDLQGFEQCAPYYNKAVFIEQLQRPISDNICFVMYRLLGCDWEEGFVSPKRTLIRLAAGPLLYLFNVFKALQAQKYTQNTLVILRFLSSLLSDMLGKDFAVNFTDVTHFFIRL